MSNPLILLADDEPHITHIIESKLKKSNFDVIVCEDGEMAFEAALEHRPDVIVTDLQMPYLSGIELAQQLFASAQCSEIPIILLTARGYAIENELQALPNVRKLLPKPFSAKDLVEDVKALLSELGEDARRAA